MAEHEGLDPMAGIGLAGPLGQGQAGPVETAALEERVRALEERLRRMQEDQGRHRDRPPESVFDRLVPPEARRHLRAAQRERLLAVRAFVDAAIKRTEDEPGGQGPGGQGRPRRPESVRID